MQESPFVSLIVTQLLEEESRLDRAECPVTLIFLISFLVLPECDDTVFREFELIFDHIMLVF